MKKLPPEIERYLLNDVEMTPEEITSSTPNELFRTCCEYEGHGRSSDAQIKRWVHAFYGVDLDVISANATLE